MDYKAFNTYCESLPATTYVVQWGGSHVWKVGGKVFAIGGWGNGKYPGVTFKVSDIKCSRNGQVCARRLIWRRGA